MKRCFAILCLILGFNVLAQPAVDQTASISDISVQFIDGVTGALKPLAGDLGDHQGDLFIIVKVKGESGMGIRGRRLRLKVSTDGSDSPPQQRAVEGVGMGVVAHAFVVPVGIVCRDIVVTASLTKQKQPASKTIRQHVACGGD